MQSWLLALSLLFLGLFLFLGIPRGLPIRLNLACRAWNEEHKKQRSRRLDRLFRLTHRTGGGTWMSIQVVFWSLLLSRRYQEREEAIFIFAVMLGQTILVTFLKQFYGRERPAAGVELMRTKSYPSGHTAAALSFAVLFSATLGRAIAPPWSYFWVTFYAIHFIFTAMGRVALDLHWVTDVLGGIAIASSLLLALGAFGYWP